jgi:hypothetical protein
MPCTEKGGVRLRKEVASLNKLVTSRFSVDNFIGLEEFSSYYCTKPVRSVINNVGCI